MAFNLNSVLSFVEQISDATPTTVDKPQGGEIYRLYFDNDPSGKCYVGQTVQGTKNRVRQHIKDAQGGKDACPLLDEATRTFGVSHMHCQVLESGIGTYEDLDEAEKYWIKRYNSKSPNGYNTTSGGQGKSKTPITFDEPSPTATIQNPLIAMAAETMIRKSELPSSVKSILNMVIH